MTKIQDKVSKIINYFREARPNVSSELNYGNEFELLVATILAAQCTDKRVNMVTPALFQRFTNVQDLSKADVEEVLTYIKSVSYPNSKAKYLVNMAMMVVEKYNGKIPNRIEDLVKLPGVGRKTANVVLAFAFGENAMPVDTHVFRVSHRLGLVSEKLKTPEKVEEVLVKRIPKEYISTAHHWLLLHGRYICTARVPHCEKCGLTELCAYYQKKCIK